MEKRITFLTNHRDFNTGSYRIWIHDLNNYFQQLNIPSQIAHDIGDEEIVIVVKGEINIARAVKQQCPWKKVGLINPKVDTYDYCDFLIVGSIEEQASLSTNKNVLLYPLIEELFQNKDIKEHTDTDVLRFCFHGHYPHLAKFDPHVKLALEEFSKEREIELLIIHGHPEFDWQIGRPDIKIKYKQWNAGTIAQDILSADIGLCPNATYVDDYKRDQVIDTGAYDTDYVVRFKNKSNSGRAFVFHQLGLPVVTDLTPSNLHILGNPEHGLIAADKHGWLKAFRQLSSSKKRNEMALKAKQEFDRLYDPLVWAKRIYTQLNEL
tara:strand:+ start:2981 stop:3946 length:966 start_codon:yes stop_codon:yes gene_type:complete